ncbi:hypothetical protein O3P69_012936 [Scylla paramamosain]|uniref:Uncharacterized protein n=1 Tax=Scylla paramamosain TaxID=85552 RepID=A0AAW0TQR9_SCYPA
MPLILRGLLADVEGLEFTGHTLLVVMVVAVLGPHGGAGEKLEHGLELITRGELTGETHAFPQARDEDRSSTHRSFPAAPLALTYLPPIQHPLPIEGSAGSATGTSATPGEVFVTPEQVVGGNPGQLNPSESHFAQTSHQHNPSDGEFESPSFGQFQPSSGDQDSDDLPAVVPGVVLPEVEEEEPEFFSKVGESKLALLGGVMGAKTAVLDGLKEARESLVTGLKSAVTAKTEAFSSLTKGSQLKHKEQRVPVGAVVPYPIYPPYPKPQQTYPQPSYPPPRVPQGLLPPPRVPKASLPAQASVPPCGVPSLSPNPLEALKAKVEGYVEAKKAAVSGALAKVEEAKATLNAKIKALFKKPSPPVVYPVKSPAGGPSATFYPFRPYPTVPLTPHKGYSIKHVPSKPLPAPVHHVKAAVPKPYPVKVYPAPLPVPTVTPTAAQTPAATLGPQVTPEPRPMLPSAPVPPPVCCSSCGFTQQRRTEKKR